MNYEFPPIGGGAGRGTYFLAKQLCSRGHQVDVLTSRLAGQPQLAQENGFYVYRVFSLRKGIHDCGFRGAFSFLLSAITTFRHLVNNNHYDCIHYYFSLPTGLLQLLPGQHQDIPYIVSLRGSDVPGYDPFNKKLQIFHRYLLTVTRKIWRQAGAVVALSKDLRRLALLSSPSAKIDVIPNGVETENIPCVQHDFSHKTLRLITVARLIERKGIQHILMAIEKLSSLDITLTIVGEGNYQQELLSIAQKLGLQDRVNFYGYSDNIAELLNDHDLFVLPSMAESFGMVFVEAMACGLPIIATKVGGIPDIVSDDNGILIEPENINELSNAISVLYSDRELLKRLAGNNRKKVEEEFSWPSVADRYEELYLRLANENHYNGIGEAY